jgi:hypothetical protein
LGIGYFRKCAKEKVLKRDNRRENFGMLRSNCEAAEGFIVERRRNMREKTESDCLLEDIAAFVKANVSIGHPLPKGLQKYIDGLFEHYDQAIEVEGGQPVEHRVLLQDIRRMVRGESPIFITEEKI